MRRVLILTLVGWLGVVLPWPTSVAIAKFTSAQQPTGVIYGRVLDAVSGQPLEEASVVLVDGRQSSVLTNSSGEFAIFDVPSGNHQLEVRKSGYVWGEFGMRWAGVNQQDFTRWHYPEGQFVPVAPGETKHIDLRLWKWAAITGRVVDEAGDPIVGAIVEAWPRMYAAGHPWLNRTYAQLARTDDRGWYRIRPLVPGDYVVVFPTPSLTLPVDRNVASREWQKSDTEIYRVLSTYRPVPGDARKPAAAGNSLGDWRLAYLGQPVPPSPLDGSAALSYPTTFYPAAMTPDKAMLVNVGAGEVHGGVDVQLTPVHTHTISGTLAGPSGAVPKTSLTLYQAGSMAFSDVQVGVAFSQPDGRFAFLAIPPGQYRLEVNDVPVDQVFVHPQSGPSWAVATGGGEGGYVRTASVRSNRPTLWANVAVTLGDQDLTDVRVALETGTRVNGRVVFDSATANKSVPLRNLVLEFDRADGRTMSVETQNEIEVAEDGTFRSVELAGGKYFLRASRVPDGWTLQSATWRGRDISVVPFESSTDRTDDVVVVLTDRPPEISGAVATRDHSPDPDAAVVIFPSDPASWIDFGANPRSIAFTRVDAAGNYRVTGLPQGDYLIVAVDDAVMSAGISPALLGALGRSATALHVAAGAKVRMDLVTQVPR